MIRALKLILVFLALSVASLQASTVLFSDDFSDDSIWPVYSGSSSVAKEVNTSYGKVTTFNVAICPATVKTYAGNKQTGYLDFRTGSSSVTSTTSYVLFPDMSFTNGGTFSVVFGAGSTGKKLQLQEWTGSEWENKDYETVNTDKSSVWYTQNWTVTGTGTKRLRLVILSSGHLYLASVHVTTNSPAIVSSSDTIRVKGLRAGLYADSLISVSPENVDVSALSATTSSSIISLSTDGSLFSNSVVLPAAGGSLYVRVDASSLDVGDYLDSVSVYAVGASLTKKVYVSLSVAEKSSDAYVLSISLDGFAGDISASSGSIVITLGDGVVYPLTDSDLSISVSDYASYDIEKFTIASAADIPSASSRVTVTAEDGTTQVYSLSFRSDSAPTAVSSAESGSVVGVVGGILFSSFQGSLAQIYSVSSTRIATEFISSHSQTLSVPAGIYVVSVSGKIFKVVVR